jgi:hypothetical protein
MTKLPLEKGALCENVLPNSNKHGKMGNKCPPGY